MPAAPSFINTAVTEGQILLSWLNPSDDSITGYQILRGPDADSLVVIEDDTGSSSTSYTDTAPPAGQTHTYGVKARNASGLGPVGTATATVPAAEVLIVARHESNDDTLVSNLGQQTDELSSGVIGPTSFGDNDELGMAFTTGNNPFGYHVTSVQIGIRTHGSGDTNPSLSIRADNGGVPSETILYTLTTSTAITGSWNLVTFATSDQTTCTPTPHIGSMPQAPAQSKSRSKILTVTTKTTSRMPIGKLATYVTADEWATHGISELAVTQRWR